VTVSIPRSLHDTRHPLGVDPHEAMWMRGGLHRVDRHGHRSVCAVLETDREGCAGCEFSVELGFGGSGSDSAPGDQVGDKLGAVGGSQKEGASASSL